uniref:Uncharacterized protein n=1 Tax=Strongyloides papillosus TaxID=174720 RepID=A0A0N5CG45_STREA
MSLLQTLNNFLLKIEDLNSPYNGVIERRPEIKDLTNDVCKKLLILQNLLSSTSNSGIEMEKNLKSLLSSDFLYDDCNSITSKNSTLSSYDDTSSHELNIHDFDIASLSKSFTNKFKISKNDTLRSIGSSSGFSDGEEDGDFEAETCRIIFNEAMKAYKEDCYAKCVRLIENNQVKKINLDLFMLCSKSYKKMILDSETPDEYEKLSVYWLDFIEKIESSNNHTTYELNFFNIKNDCLWKCITRRTIDITLFIKFSTKLFKTNWRIFEIVTKNPNCKNRDYLTLINNLITILRYCIDEGLEREENEIKKLNSFDSKKTGLQFNDDRMNVHLLPILRLEILNVKNSLKIYNSGERYKNKSSVQLLCDDKDKLLYQKISGKLREVEEDFVRKSMVQNSQPSSVKVNEKSSFSRVVMRCKNPSNTQRRDIKSTPPEVFSTQINDDNEKSINSSSNESGRHFLKLMIEPDKGISLIKEEETDNKSIILRF